MTRKLRSGVIGIVCLLSACNNPDLLGDWFGSSQVTSMRRDNMSFGHDGTGYVFLNYTVSGMVSMDHHAEYDATWTDLGSNRYAIHGACVSRDDDFSSDCHDVDFDMTCNLPAEDPDTHKVSSFTCTFPESLATFGGEVAGYNGTLYWSDK